MGITTTNKKNSNESRIPDLQVILILILVTVTGIGAAMIVYSAISNHSPQPLPAKPYLNTSHYPVFTPYIQNTSIWLTINGSIYQYWASLDNYALGATPCVLRMNAVENGNVTHTLNKTEANATLTSAQIIESSGTSSRQPEYTNPVTSYFGGLSVCSNYEMK